MGQSSDEGVVQLVLTLPNDGALTQRSCGWWKTLSDEAYRAETYAPERELQKTPAN